MKEYYDTRAPEYDDWWLGRGLWAGRERPGWEDELAEIATLLGGLPPTRTLDVACGTAFITQHLRGDVVGLDQSPRMLEEAQQRLPRATFV
ncbi:MAG TPA: methyltransferase domain-containing protein, partial [Gaiellaceae bacterium]|nr:methyltransferase domain-containing protein [Gaiellaceae bacterium]